MIHNLDRALTRLSRSHALARPGRPAPGVACAAAHTSPADTAPAGDGRRLGLSRVGDPLSLAALRVLETTWRLWREPRAS